MKSVIIVIVILILSLILAVGVGGTWWSVGGVVLDDVADVVQAGGQHTVLVLHIQGEHAEFDDQICDIALKSADFALKFFHCIAEEIVCARYWTYIRFLY